MPRSKGHTHIKRRRPTQEVAEELETQEVVAHNGSAAAVEEQLGTGAMIIAGAPPSSISHAALAKLLWSTDYVPLFFHELKQYRHIAVCELQCPPTVHSSLLSYVARVRLAGACD